MERIEELFTRDHIDVKVLEISIAVLSRDIKVNILFSCKMLKEERLQVSLLLIDK